MSYRNYSTVNGFIVAQNGTADFTSINAAITAIIAKGLTDYKLYLTDPLYTENVTFPTGGLISALPGSNRQQNITILGTVSFSGTGTITLNSLNLRTNGASAINIVGSNVITVRLDNCIINSTNFTGILANNSNSTLNLSNCILLSSTSLFAIISITAILDSSYNYCVFNIGSNVPNNFASGLSQLFYCTGNQAFSTSGTGSLIFRDCVFDTNVSGLTIPQCQFNGSLSTITNCTLISGIQTTIVNNSSLQLIDTIVDSIAVSTNAITGTGTSVITNIDFTGTATNIIQSAISPELTAIGELRLLNSTVTGSIPYVQGTNGHLIPLVPAQNGDILQLNEGVPTWSAPSFPITVGGLGTIIRSNGTDWLSTTATYPNTTTINQVLYSNAANAITGLATANNAVLATNATGVPSITPTPTLTSLTFGAGTALSSYVEGTFTPILTGQTTAGVTTYTFQQGFYTRIGNLVTIIISIQGSAATGTGNVVIGNLPFTIKNQTQGNPVGPCLSQSSNLWVFPAGTTNIQGFGILGTNNMFVYGTGSGTTGGFLQMINSAFIFYVTMTYQI